MTTNEIVKDKLEKFPIFRERSKRGIYLSKLALRAIGLETKTEPLTLEEMTEFAIKFATYERAWRDVLADKENAHLRGSDYDDKIRLEQEAQISLGYEPNYHQNRKELNKI